MWTASSFTSVIGELALEDFLRPRVAYMTSRCTPVWSEGCRRLWDCYTPLPGCLAPPQHSFYFKSSFVAGFYETFPLISHFPVCFITSLSASMFVQ